jgi:hypothetical protein
VIYVPSETDLAYIAGLIDGEGHIGVKKSKAYKHLTGRVSPGYHARICIKMVDEAAIRFVAETLGGWYFLEKRAIGGLSKRQLYAYQATDKSAETILRALLPYMRVKRGQAEAVLELRALQATGSKHRTRETGTRPFKHWTGKEVTIKTYAFSDEYIAMCDSLHQRCKNLNRPPA